MHIFTYLSEQSETRSMPARRQRLGEHKPGRIKPGRIKRAAVSLQNQKYYIFLF